MARVKCLLVGNQRLTSNRVSMPYGDILRDKAAGNLPTLPSEYLFSFFPLLISTLCCYLIHRYWYLV